MTPQFSLDDAEAHEQPSVLLVDDDGVSLLMTAYALRDRGFRITEATSGEQALALLRAETPDVVVLDALMPGLDGFETCRTLRAMHSYENVPVLMLTGLDDDASITRAYEAGATDFYVKSTQWSLLAGRLRYLLRSSRTRQELERNRARLARAQELARMGNFDWRAGVDGMVMSPEALRVFGLGAGTRVTLPALLLSVERNERRLLLDRLKEWHRHASPLATDVAVYLPDGRQRIIHLEAEPEFNEHGHNIGYSGIVQDVTDRRSAEDKIRHLANFDSLTGLPNRRHLVWRTERALDQARRLQQQFALLMIDLDRFKIVNDTLGHSAGDELLFEVARRLRACVRHSDTVTDSAMDPVSGRSNRTLEAVGRLGGDEFVALLPEVGDERDAQAVADRILKVMREPIVVAGQECFTTASVGIAMYPRDGETVADIMRNADMAMYAAKDAGRNGKSVYSPSLVGRGQRVLELEAALHKAIERHELVLHYQPKMDVRRSRMVGVEALMRWNRNGVLVAPGEFIPLAEETGLIVPLSEWALKEACEQAARWRKRIDFQDSIAVNLPTQMFNRSDLSSKINRYAEEAGVPPYVIKLEITESNLMKELKDVMPALHALNDLGVEISIDDFGTGYSSLSYLTELPISELKIDRRFVCNLGLTPQSSAVVQAIIALARSLGLLVVAEGVESLSQMTELSRLGCNVMQGFLFSRAVHADDLETWLQQTVTPRKAPWMDHFGADNSDLRLMAGR
ncbi:MAG: putative bifunctional diguanylate cyclase/phosphodiesterase [Rubrivivax sp.]